MRGVLFVFLACAGCATVLASGTQPISIEANPGSQIIVDGQAVGPSPAIIEVPSHSDHTITVGDKTCHLEASVGAGWLILDILLIEMVFPIVVDAVTGDWKSIHATECRI